MMQGIAKTKNNYVLKGYYKIFGDNYRESNIGWL